MQQCQDQRRLQAPQQQQQRHTSRTSVLWQSSKDKTERVWVVNRINSLLRAKKPDALKELLKKLPDMARRLEDLLYHSAQSKEEYINFETLEQRLQEVAIKMGAHVSQKKGRTSSIGNHSHRNSLEHKHSDSSNGSSGSSGGTKFVNLNEVNPNLANNSKSKSSDSSAKRPIKKASCKMFDSSVLLDIQEKHAHKIRQQQQRLLLLRHASKCCNGPDCQATSLCSQMKKLWAHIAKCKDQNCTVSHCVSSRYILSHYKQCKDRQCQVCGPVRHAISNQHDGAKQKLTSSTFLHNLDVKNLKTPEASFTWKNHNSSEYQKIIQNLSKCVKGQNLSKCVQGTDFSIPSSSNLLKQSRQESGNFFPVLIGGDSAKTATTAIEAYLDSGATHTFINEPAVEQILKYQDPNNPALILHDPPEKKSCRLSADGSLGTPIKKIGILHARCLWQEGHFLMLHQRVVVIPGKTPIIVLGQDAQRSWGIPCPGAQLAKIINDKVNGPSDTCTREHELKSMLPKTKQNSTTTVNTHGAETTTLKKVRFKNISSKSVSPHGAVTNDENSNLKYNDGVTMFGECLPNTHSSINMAEKNSAADAAKYIYQSKYSKQKIRIISTQKARQRAIHLHMKLLVHASGCRNSDSTGGCNRCRRIWALLQIHARQCKTQDCPVPRCRDLKDHLRRVRRGHQQLQNNNSRATSVSQKIVPLITSIMPGSLAMYAKAAYH
eukprot:GSMAST32.ASY1.ANO1.2023.1 assembled CDS